MLCSMALAVTLCYYGLQGVIQPNKEGKVMFIEVGYVYNLNRKPCYFQMNCNNNLLYSSLRPINNVFSAYFIISFWGHKCGANEVHKASLPSLTSPAGAEENKGTH